MTMRKLDLTGRFFEAPRWHNGRWWVSDMTDRVVYSLSLAGISRMEATLGDRPSGLGWLPDGSMVVVSMDDRLLLRQRPGIAELEVYADLVSVCPDVHGHLNDMVASADGHLYVGFDPDFEEHGFQSELGCILHVSPNGMTEVVTRGLFFPNGMVITDDGATLIVAETGRAGLQQFPIGSAGALGDGRVWAALDCGADRRTDKRQPLALASAAPDGCALDAEGHVWVADSNSGACLRVAKGGDIADAIFLPEPYRCLACALGGEDGRTLIASGLDLKPGGLRSSVSHLFSGIVSVPGASV